MAPGAGGAWHLLPALRPVGSCEGRRVRSGSPRGPYLELALGVGVVGLREI